MMIVRFVLHGLLAVVVLLILGIGWIYRMCCKYFSKKTGTIILAVFGVILVGVSLGIATHHEHMWVEASCVAPRTCSDCGKTQGKELGHTWRDASCAAPQTCSVRGETEGAALDHNWLDANCTAPQTCSVCGATEGSALPHIYGVWETETEATVLTSGKKTRSCSSCHNTESEYFQLDTYVHNNEFVFTPEEFRELFFDNFVELGYSKFGGAQVREKDGQVVVAIVDSGYNNVGNIGFVTDGNSLHMATSKNESGFDGIVMIISAHEEFVANAMISAIMTCDPSVTEYDAREIGRSVLSEKTTYGDITYTFTVTENYYMMTAVVSN